MRVVAFALVIIAGCGGLMATPDEASRADSGTSGGSYFGPFVGVADASLPQAGTLACEGQDPDADVPSHCLLCTDDRWHCGRTPDAGAVFCQCPASTQKGGACTDWVAPDGCSPGSCVLNCPGRNVGLFFLCNGGSDEWWAPYADACP